MLGLYISDHPLMGLEGSLARLTDCTLAELRDFDADAGRGRRVGTGYGGEGQIRQVGGVVTDLTRRYTKKGDLMATFVLEDLNASIEVFVFPKTMADYGALLDDDAIVVLKGRVDMRDDRLKLVCMEVQRPELAAEGSTDLRISLPLNSLTDQHGRRAEAPPGRASRRFACLPPRRREGPPPPLRVQRGQPAGPGRRAAGPARAQRHRG